MKISNSKTLVKVYYLLASFGLIATWFYNIQHFIESESILFGSYLESLLVNFATTAVTVDIYIAALVFSVWVYFESKKLGVKWPFAYIFICFFVGIAIAFPLFLAVREKNLSHAVGKS